MAKRERKSVHHVEMTDGKRAIIQGLLQEYDIQNAQDIQDALKDLLEWTMPIRNWGQILGELAIMYPDRIPE
jgi:transposase-like protein